MSYLLIWCPKYNNLRVKFIIAKLQKKGLLKRVGGRKFGEWLVFI